MVKDLVKGVFVLTLALVAMGCGGEERKSRAAASETAEATPVDFAASVLPIFEERCAKCHIDREVGEERGELRLDSLENALKGGKSGLVIQASNSADSLMYQYITGTHPDRKMPPKGDPLTAEQIETIKNWIDQGAK